MEYMSGYAPQLKSKPEAGNAQSIMDLIASQEFQNPSKPEPMMSSDTASSTISGLQSGGVSGALTSGGLSSMLGAGGMSGGGPYALAGGLILSQIEAAQKAKAAQEQERIMNENKRNAALIAQYNANASQRYEA